VTNDRFNNANLNREKSLHHIYNLIMSIWFLCFSIRKHITVEVIMALKRTVKILLNRSTTTFFSVYVNCWAIKQKTLMIIWLGMTGCNYDVIKIYDIMCRPNRKILCMIQQIWEGTIANSACNYDAIANIVAGYIQITMKYTLCAKRSASLHHQQNLEGITAKKYNLNTHITKRGYVEFT
jgi:hypothetical protein